MGYLAAPLRSSFVQNPSVFLEIRFRPMYTMSGLQCALMLKFLFLLFKIILVVSPACLPQFADV